MGKKVLSLLLSLSMIMAITANCVVVSAESTPVLTVTYYEDEALSTKIGDNTVEKGDIFYAAVSVKGFEQYIQTGTTTIGYAPEFVGLVDFSSKDDVVIPDDGAEGIANDVALKYGFEVKSLNSLKNNKSVRMPKIEKVADRYSTTGVISGKETVLLTVGWKDGDDTAMAQEEAVLLVLKLKAKADGKTSFIFPRKTTGFSGDYYAVRNANNTEFACGEYGDYVFMDDITFVIPELSIVTNIPKLDAPTGIDIKDGKITWLPVDKASGYEVTVVSENGVGAGTYNIAASDISGTSAKLPEAIKCGDVTVSVKAISNKPTELLSSDAATYTKKLTMKLTPVKNLVWNETNSTEVVWDAVEGATSYRVELTDNSTSPAPAPVVYTTKSTAYDFKDDLKDPAEGEKKVYDVKVYAIGDGTYVEDDTTGASALTKIKLGTVKNVSTAGWDGTTTKAVWTDENKAEIVEGYILTLYRGGKLIAGNIKTTNKYYDFDKYMTEAGEYTYDVKVLGAQTADGKYEDSTEARRSTIQPVTKQREKVTDIVWNDRSISWTDDKNPACVYRVSLWKDGAEVFTTGDDFVTEKNFNFDTVTPPLALLGVYTAKVQAVGSGNIYTDSEWAINVKDGEFTLPRHSDPEDLKWDGTKATWKADPNAVNGYIVSLYYNGVEIGESYPTPVAEYDFSGKMDMVGKYTFSVIKNETHDFMKSIKKVGEDAYDFNSVTRKGNLNVKFYEEDGTTPLTSINAGQIFYTVISIEGTDAYDVMSVPFKFDKSLVKVVGNDNAVVTDGTLSNEILTSGEKGVTVGDAFDGMSLIFDHAYVSNEDGLVVVQGVGYKTAPVGEEIVLKIRMVANAYTTEKVKFSFASANTDGEPYEPSILGGFTIAKDDILYFTNEYIAEINGIGKGTLAKMAAPVWDGTQIKWNKADSANVTGYTVELYKDEGASPIETFADITPDTNTLDLTDYVKSVGKYTVRIKARGDANVTDSDFSDMSEAYEKRYTGGGGGGSLKPITPVEPDKPDTPVTPDKPEVEFTDIAGHWAEDKIKELSKYGVLAGYGDGTFRPNFGITRAEFTTLMVSCLGYNDYEVEEPVVYDDTTEHWAQKSIAIATELGIVSGIGDNLFAPDVIITREQVAAIIYRAAEVTEEIPVCGYTDRDAVTEYAKTAVDYAAHYDIMIGFEDNTFRGTENITRAQMAIVLLKLLQNGFFAELNVNLDV